MKNIREVLRLSLQLNLSANEIHRATGISRAKAQEIVRLAKEQQLDWRTVCDMDESKLEALLFPVVKQAPSKHLPPNWEHVHKELKRKGVTLKLLWREYKSDKQEGHYSYQQFCRIYRRWKRKCDVVMLQVHEAGETLFVDYAGQTVAITDRATGEVKFAQIFVAVMGASNYSYFEASWSQDLRSWVGAHVRALSFLGGVPTFLVPDNLKSAVTEAERFDPLLNRTYRRLAEHYDCGIRPARPYHARDKAKAEKGVQVVENWVLAALRDYDFFSLEQLNTKLRELHAFLNNEPFQELSGNRRSWFEEVDAPALKRLPESPFEYEEWLVEVKVPKHYHVTVEKHRYSVPYRLTGERVDVRVTDNLIEVFHNNGRVASHVRSWAEGKKTSDENHMPPAHRDYHGASPEKFIFEAQTIGPATTKVIKAILESKPYPQLSFDQCYGVLRYLKNKHGPTALESACEYSLSIGSPAYRIVKQVLLQGLENLPVQLSLPDSLRAAHKNIRGPQHFSQS